jgi:outer membrane PBP1 activator LpoA protein
MGTVAVLLLLFVLATPVAARDVAGVALPDTAVAEGKTLVLNGAGLRTRFFFKVYVLGLYLERPATDAAAILGSDSIRRAELHILRSLTGDEIASAIRTAFEQNAGDALPRLQDRLKRLESMFPAVEAGDTIALTYVPGRGTEVVAKRQAKGVIEGKDFADALFAVWIGAKPVDPELRKALLAGGR